MAEKWRPTASVCLCLRLKKCEVYLCAIVFLFLRFLACLTNDAINQVGLLATNILLYVSCVRALRRLFLDEKKAENTFIVCAGSFEVSCGPGFSRFDLVGRECCSFQESFDGGLFGVWYWGILFCVLWLVLDFAVIP